MQENAERPQRANGTLIRHVPLALTFPISFPCIIIMVYFLEHFTLTYLLMSSRVCLFIWLISVSLPLPDDRQSPWGSDLWLFYSPLYPPCPERCRHRIGTSQILVQLISDAFYCLPYTRKIFRRHIFLAPGFLKIFSPARGHSYEPPSRGDTVMEGRMGYRGGGVFNSLRFDQPHLWSVRSSYYLQLNFWFPAYPRLGLSCVFIG